MRWGKTKFPTKHRKFNFTQLIPVLFAIFAMLVSNVPSSIAYAAGSDVSSDVTSVSVNPGHINDGGKTTFKMSYDDHAQKIRGGDTITVNWPSSGTVYGEGYSKTIDLFIDGVNVGVLKVTPQNAVVTFNDNINDMENVHGWAEFDIEGRNLADTSDENTGSFTISSGGYSTSVSVTKPKSGTTGVFYYKTGDMQPSDTDHVRWFLNMNNEKAYVDGRIYIKDQIQPGQTLDTTSFDITVDGYRTGHYNGKDAIANFEKDFPGSSISVDAASGELTVVVPQDQANLNSFSIMYLTSVDDYNQKQFDNKSQAWYHEHNKDAVNGKEFDHTVQNVNADGGIDGQNKTTASVKKVWDDNNNSMHKRPSSILVQLYANNKVTGQPVTLSSANNWEYKWDSLVKNVKGAPVKYTAREVTVPTGYKSTSTSTGVNEITLTNKYESVEKIDITGKKVWDDADNQDGVRPSAVTITLLQNGKEYQTTQATAANNWKYSFNQVPKTDSNGNAYTYTVKEAAVEGYTSKVSGYNVTNIRTPGKTSLFVAKNWCDADNQDGTRPSSVQVQLYADGVATGDPVTLSEANKWSYTFTGLPVNARGNKIAYTVKEVNTPKGYTSVVTGDATKGYILTNKHTPEATAVSVVKKWVDADNQDGTRTSSVQVQLYADGVATGDPVTLNAANSWKYQWTGLKAKNNGAAVAYTVKEVNTPAGYTAEVSGDQTSGYTLTNKHTPEVTAVCVAKKWVDADNQDGTRPDSVQVQLYADGQAQGDPVTLNAANSWKYQWTGLAKNKAGKAIAYTVKEVSEAKGYTAAVVGDATTGYLVTNTHTPEVTRVYGHKVWNDNNNQDGTRPKTIIVRLTANGGTAKDAAGQEVKPLTVGDSDGWKFSFNNLPVYKDGHKIVYAITEDSNDGYQQKFDLSYTHEHEYTITNTHTPGKTSLSVAKNWSDADNQDGTRTSSVQVQLYADGVATGDPVTLNAENQWKYNWSDLDVYKNGTPIKYTVQEVNTPEGYTAKITGDATQGYTITNEHTPEVTAVSVAKVWDDKNNADKIRPDSVQVQLYADGVATGDPVTLNAANSWKYQWTGLAKNKAGKAIAYTVKEVNTPKGYTAAVTGDAETGFTITNTHPVKPPTPTTPPTPNKPSKPVTPPTPNKPQKPKLARTGTGFIALASGVLVAAVLAVILLAVRRRSADKD